MQISESRSIEDAKRIVAQLSFGARITPWAASNAPQWEYADFTVGDHTLRVGVSTGGVISFNGDPFTLSKRQMCVTYETARQSLAERLAQKVLQSRPVGAAIQ